MFNEVFSNETVGARSSTFGIPLLDQAPLVYPCSIGQRLYMIAGETVSIEHIQFMLDRSNPYNVL